MRNILIVDDDINIRETLKEILEENAYIVSIGGTGREAILCCKNDKLDGVLLDLRLPDMDGIEVLREILHVNREVPVIVISAFGTIDKAVEAVKMGAYDFIEKPLQEEKLLITLRNALGQKILKEELKEIRESGFSKYGMIGVSSDMQKVFRSIEQAASNNAPVLITGESGAGKELVARAIHNLSKGDKWPFIPINCSSIPENLFESELFGYEKGAFTDAKQKKIGKLEKADGGTVLFDEIGDMPLLLQPKLLRWMEDGRLERIGGIKVIKTDVRIISSTNQNLKNLIKEKKFRNDLYYRINTLYIRIPPLRERRDDILPLIDFYKSWFDKKYKPHILSQSAINFFTGYPFPGNVRELRSIIERLWVTARNEIIELTDVFTIIEREKMVKKPLRSARKEFEKRYIYEILKEVDGNIARASQILGIERTNLYRKIRNLGIKLK